MDVNGSSDPQPFDSRGRGACGSERRPPSDPARRAPHDSLARPGRGEAGPSKDGQVPSGSLLLESAATAYGRRAVGVILTGIGTNGVDGIAAIRAQGGVTIAQSQDSAIVFGMPGAAISRWVIDHVVHTDELGAAAPGARRVDCHAALTAPTRRRADVQPVSEACILRRGRKDFTPAGGHLLGDVKDEDVVAWERRLREAEAFDSPANRSRLPYLCYRVGNALRLSGQPQAALKNYFRAAALSKDLPPGPNQSEDWAFLTYETAILARDLGSAEASTWLHESIRAQEALPETAGTLEIVGILHGELGDWNLNQGDLRWACEHYARAIAKAEQAIQADPRNASASRNLGVSLSKLAQAQTQAGELEAAFATHFRAFELRQALAHDSPESEVARAGPLVSLELLTELSERMGRADRQEWSARYQRELTSYRADFPTVP